MKLTGPFKPLIGNHWVSKLVVIPDLSPRPILCQYYSLAFRFSTKTNIYVDNLNLDIKVKPMFCVSAVPTVK